MHCAAVGDNNDFGDIVLKKMDGKMSSGATMVEEENRTHPGPPRVSREQIGASQPPGPLPRRPSSIPPPPLPFAQPQPLPLIPKRSVDEDCVTRRFYVDVFHPVSPVVNSTEDSLDAVDSIQITPEDTPQVSYKQTLFDIDEDAVTKEIRIRRIDDSSDGNQARPAVQIRTLPADDTLWQKRRIQKAKTDVGRLLSSVIPRFLAMVGKTTTFFASHTSIQNHKPVRSKQLPTKNSVRREDKNRLRLSVNSYTRDLYREIRNALNPAAVGEVPRIGTEAYSIALLDPPKISVNALLIRRTDKYSLLIRGKASHPIAIRDIMVFADKKKILYLSNALRDDAGYMEFSADVPLLGAVNSILVVARHDDQVMGSQSLMITKTNPA